MSLGSCFIVSPAPENCLIVVINLIVVSLWVPRNLAVWVRCCSFAPSRLGSITLADISRIVWNRDSVGPCECGGLVGPSNVEPLRLFNRMDCASLLLPLTVRCILSYKYPSFTWLSVRKKCWSFWRNSKPCSCAKVARLAFRAWILSRAWWGFNLGGIAAMATLSLIFLAVSTSDLYASMVASRSQSSGANEASFHPPTIQCGHMLRTWHSEPQLP